MVKSCNARKEYKQEMLACRREQSARIPWVAFSVFAGPWYATSKPGCNVKVGVAQKRSPHVKVFDMTFALEIHLLR